MTPSSVVILIGIVLLVVIWVVRSERRKAREKAQLLSTMGFQPVERLDPQLAEALLGLFRRGGLRGKPLKLWRMFRCDSTAGQILVFDVLDPPSRRQSRVATSAVGIVRRGTRLPAFEICAYTEEGGAASRMMVRFISQGLGHGQVVRFGDLPEFSRRFTVLSTGGNGEEAVRGYLTPGVRQKLMDCQFLVLAAEGDAFALQPNPVPSSKRVKDVDLLRNMVEEAIQLAQVLQPPAPLS
jgi:hypothetical protein